MLVGNQWSEIKNNTVLISGRSGLILCLTLILRLSERRFAGEWWIGGCLRSRGAVDLIYFILQVIWHNGNNDDEIGFSLLKKAFYSVHKYVGPRIPLSAEGHYPVTTSSYSNVHSVILVAQSDPCISRMSICLYSAFRTVKMISFPGISCLPTCKRSRNPVKGPFLSFRALCPYGSFQKTIFCCYKPFSHQCEPYYLLQDN